MNPFPPPFKAAVSKSGGEDGRFVIGAMFTRGFAQKAERLAASCEKFGLPYVLYEVPAVHRSLNGRVGTDDTSFTKPNFIRHLLDAYQRPVLYIDADCEFVAEPVLVDQLVRSERDFAIYNWLADDYVDRFVPLELTLVEEPSSKTRFYRFFDGLGDGMFSTEQLLCSGLAQFYGNSDAARFLLAEWQRTVETFPGAGDDPCLSFVFNNLGLRAKALKVQWLPKAYARISWWIYAKPIINHSEMPHPDRDFIAIDDPSGRKMIYRELMGKRDLTRLFPRDCIIDTERRILWKIRGNKLVAVKPTNQTFWL